MWPAHNMHKMFLQWCGDGLILSSIFVHRLVWWDRAKVLIARWTISSSLAVSLKRHGEFKNLMQKIIWTE